MSLNLYFWMRRGVGPAAAALALTVSLGLILVVCPEIVRRGWFEGSGGVLLADLSLAIMQVMVAFVSILVVYVVFKIANVFGQLESMSHSQDSSAPNLVASAEIEARYKLLLDLKEAYVAPLRPPIIALVTLAGVSLLVFPFSSVIASDQTRELRVLLSLIIVTIFTIGYAIQVAFTTAIER